MKKVLVLSLIAFVTTGLAMAKPKPVSDERSQERISREVRHELVMLPQYGIFDNLAYKVDGDTVVLMGQVKNAVLKDSAAKVVAHIEGVEKVENKIEILPPSFFDDRIRFSEARAIFRYDGLSRYSMGAV